MAILLLTGCVGPMVTETGYRNKLTGTARQLQGAIASARMAARLDQEGRMAFAVTDTTISDAESDAADAQQILASRQPPDPAAQHLYDRARQPFQDAVTALRDLRVAERRGDRAGVDASLSELDRSDRELDPFTSGTS